MRCNALWRVAAPAVLAVAVLMTLTSGTARAVRWGANYFPNFPVVTQDGKTVRFYDDLIKGKIVVINFVYTSCSDICSLATARMARVRDSLADVVGRRVFIYSISIDPEHDTPKALKTFAEPFGGGDDGWLFLTGRPDQIHTLRWKLGERSRYLAEHRTDMVIGNDATGFWRRISLMGNLKILSQRVRELDPEWRARKRIVSVSGVVPKRSDYVIPDRPGEAMFLKACSYCHTIGRGDRVGPDLMGVTVRRDPDWLTRFIMTPDEMLARKDPIAVRLKTAFKSAVMPNLGLSREDAADLIAYLKAQTALIVDSAEVPAPSPHHDHDHDKHRH